MAFFEHSFDVGFRDVGKSNTLTNISFLSFMEDLGGLHSEHAGYGINSIETCHLSWILIGWKLKVIRRPIYGEKVRIVTWGKDFNKVHAIRDFEAYDEKNNLVAVATSKWVLCNTETAKLCRIPMEVIDAYTVERKSAIDEDYSFSINTTYSESPQNTFNFTFLRNNIDINNHVHNLYYLDLAYEALPEDIYQNNDFNNVEIIYKKECYLYDKVKCEYYFIDGAHYVYVKSEDGSVLHTIIKLY